MIYGRGDRNAPTGPEAYVVRGYHVLPARGSFVHWFG